MFTFECCLKHARMLKTTLRVFKSSIFALQVDPERFHSRRLLWHRGRPCVRAFFCPLLLAHHQRAHTTMQPIVCMSQYFSEAEACCLRCSVEASLACADTHRITQHSRQSPLWCISCAPGAGTAPCQKPSTSDTVRIHILHKHTAVCNAASHRNSAGSRILTVECGI